MIGELTKSLWPVGASSLDAAICFLSSCISQPNPNPTLLIPDKDADGLCATQIVYRTLLDLSFPACHLHVHFLSKGSNVFSLKERKIIEEEYVKKRGVRKVILVDMGSRRFTGPLFGSNPVEVLVVDHHWSQGIFPEGAIVLSSSSSPPIATSSTLAYILCLSFLKSQSSSSTAASLGLDYLCHIGTSGDLGSVDWSSFAKEGGYYGELLLEDMKACEKKWTKKVLRDCVGLINAPRRTARFDVGTAWEALAQTTAPKFFLTIPSNPTTASTLIRRLYEAREEVRTEVDKWSRGKGRGPVFSGDGRIALLRVRSRAQIHPVVATRWANTLKSSKLQIVICANDGYLDFDDPTSSISSPTSTPTNAGTGIVTNFSCRIAKCASKRDDASQIDIMEVLKSYADRVEGLRARLERGVEGGGGGDNEQRQGEGGNFAQGHKEASGGIVRTEDFECLWDAILHAPGVDTDSGRGSGMSRKRKRDGEDQDQPTLDSWLRRRDA